MKFDACESFEPMGKNFCFSPNSLTHMITMIDIAGMLLQPNLQFNDSWNEDIRILMVWQNEVIDPTVNGVLDIMRACTKAKTVKRFIYTSTTGTITVGPEPLPLEYDESFWTDVDYCKAQKMTAWVSIFSISYHIFFKILFNLDLWL